MQKHFTCKSVSFQYILLQNKCGKRVCIYRGFFSAKYSNDFSPQQLWNYKRGFYSSVKLPHRQSLYSQCPWPTHSLHQSCCKEIYQEWDFACIRLAGAMRLHMMSHCVAAKAQSCSTCSRFIDMDDEALTFSRTAAVTLNTAFMCVCVCVYECVFASYGDTEVPSAAGSNAAAWISSHRCADIHPAPSPSRRSAPHNCSTQGTRAEETASYTPHTAATYKPQLITLTALQYLEELWVTADDVPAVGRANAAEAVWAAAGGAGGPGGAGGVQVLPLWDITPTRRRSLKEKRRSMSFVTNITMKYYFLYIFVGSY